MNNTNYPPIKRRKRKNRRTGAGAVLSVLILSAVILAGCLAGCIQIMENITQGKASNAGPSASDTTPPTIEGVKNITVCLGDAISYRSGITVTDDHDPAPSLTVDTSLVDLTTPGTYKIVYIAADASGNTTRMEAKVTVQEGPKDDPEPDDPIDAAVDRVLDEIITGNMTTREQVRAIYTWARTNIGYGGHSDRTDWRKTGYKTLTNRQGDCFGYFALTKLMFERLEIPNIDVQKVRNFPEDSDHFWSLVSVDGGETWYHFDATPRVGNGDNFCLVTDEFLDEYSASHKGSHNRDKSLYPATP